jgi:hypothetical protein
MTIFNIIKRLYRLPFLLAVAVVLLAAPAAIQAQTEWMNLSWGMSYQEVVERQPSARAMADKHNRQGMFYDVFARIDNVVVADVPFRADLLFDSEIRLTGVVMKAYGPSAALSPGYTRLLQELTDRHGRPTANRSIPNHPGNYSWNTDVSEIRLSYTEMVKGEADIVLAYYQTAIIERRPMVVVQRDTAVARQDTVVVPPQITSMTVTMPLPTSATMQTDAPDSTTTASKMLSFGEFSVQASSDLEENGFKSIGLGLGMIGFDAGSKWIPYSVNGYFEIGRSIQSQADSRLFEGYRVVIRTNTFGLKLGMGIPKTNTVIYGIVEMYRFKYDVSSGTYVIPSGQGGLQTSVGAGVKYYVNPSDDGFVIGIEHSELRLLGVSIGYTF